LGGRAEESPVHQKADKRVKPLDVHYMDDYISRMHMHYMSYTNAAIIRHLQVTQDEKDGYEDYLEA